jgi:hypothetical protein
MTLIYNEAVGLLNHANSLVISTLDDVQRATNDLSLTTNCKKRMEPIEQADTIPRQTVLAHQKEQARIAAEQERINTLKMEAAKAEAALNNGEIKEEINLVPITAVPEKVNADIGSLGTMKIKKYRIINFAILPDQYKIENVVLLNKVVKAGIPSIPGVEIYEEETLRVNAR